MTDTFENTFNFCCDVGLIVFVSQALCTAKRAVLPTDVRPTAAADSSCIAADMSQPLPLSSPVAGVRED